MNKLISIIILTLLCLIGTGSVIASSPGFIIEKQIEATTVKNQWRSSTCWTFATLSLLETELLQNGKGNFDLSEMYVVRNVYLQKARHYIRMHGYNKFTGGGSIIDVLETIKSYGIMPESAYSGLENINLKHNHIEMDTILHNYADSIIDQLILHKSLKENWEKGYNKLLDKYLGKLPSTFLYNKKEYTPLTFLKWLEIKPDDYAILMSFNNYPFYQYQYLEIPDNWSNCKAYNIPLSEFTEITLNAIHNNYSVSMACDISETGFDWHKGFALLSEGVKYDEQTITDSMRSVAFDNYQTTDDHAMHIIGFASDSAANKYLLMKNSWGIENTCTSGYIYMSYPYFQYKTLCILLNRKALPPHLSQKMLIR